MTRLLLLCLSVAVISACKKSDAPESVSAVPARDGAKQEEKRSAAEPDVKQVDPASDAKPALSPSMIEPFVAYRRDALAAMVQASKAEHERAKHKGGDGRVDDFDLTAAYEAALKRSGLTEAQLSALQEIANEILSVRTSPANAAAEGAEARQLAPAARSKYGDGIVDAMLAQRAELERLDDDEELLAQANDDEDMKQQRDEIIADAQEPVSDAAGAESRCEVEGMVIDPDPAGLNVRADASARAEVVGKIPMDPDGTIVEIVDARDGWLQLRGFRPMNADPVKVSGWVSGRMIATAVRCPEETPAEDCTVALRKEPESGAAEVRRLATESRLLIVGCRGGWVEGETTEANRGERSRGWLEANGQCANPVTSCP